MPPHAVCSVSSSSPVIVTHDHRFERFVTKYHRRFTAKCKNKELRLSKAQMKTMITFCMTQRERTRAINWPFVTAKFGFEKKVIRNMVRAWQEKMKNEGIVTDGTVSTASDVDAHQLADVPDIANPLSNPLDSLLDILLCPPLVYPPISYEELQIPDDPPFSTFV